MKKTQQKANGINTLIPTKPDLTTEVKLAKWIGQKLEGYRKAAKVPTSDIAAVLNCSINHVRNLEKGAAFIRINELQRMADFWKVSLQDLVPTAEELKFTKDELTAVNSLVNLGWDREQAINTVLGKH